MEIFMKIQEKSLTYFESHYLTNQGKNKDENKIFWKNEFDL